MGQDAMVDLQQVGGKEFLVPSMASRDSSKIAVAQINKSQLNTLSRLIHVNHHRCGGYIVHDSLQSALLNLQQSEQTSNFVTTEFAVTIAVHIRMATAKPVLWTIQPQAQYTLTLKGIRLLVT
ncbi:MAG: leucyl aminopeptidase [Phenylobacterium sp.]|jgi:leucyl aminopeptidase